MLSSSVDTLLINELNIIIHQIMRYILVQFHIIASLLTNVDMNSSRSPVKKESASISYVLKANISMNHPLQ
jgi:hypothetical protein